MIATNRNITIIIIFTSQFKFLTKIHIAPKWLADFEIGMGMQPLLATVAKEERKRVREKLNDQWPHMAQTNKQTNTPLTKKTYYHRTTQNKNHNALFIIDKKTRYIGDAEKKRNKSQQ